MKVRECESMTYRSDILLDVFGNEISLRIVKAIQTDTIAVEVQVRAIDGDNLSPSVGFGYSSILFHAYDFRPNFIVYLFPFV